MIYRFTKIEPDIISFIQAMYINYVVSSFYGYSAASTV